MGNIKRKKKITSIQCNLPWNENNANYPGITLTVPRSNRKGYDSRVILLFIARRESVRGQSSGNNPVLSSVFGKRLLLFQFFLYWFWAQISHLKKKKRIKGGNTFSVIKAYKINFPNSFALPSCKFFKGVNELNRGFFFSSSRDNDSHYCAFRFYINPPLGNLKI